MRKQRLPAQNPLSNKRYQEKWRSRKATAPPLLVIAATATSSRKQHQQIQKNIRQKNGIEQLWRNVLWIIAIEKRNWSLTNRQSLRMSSLFLFRPFPLLCSAFFWSLSCASFQEDIHCFWSCLFRAIRLTQVTLYLHLTTFVLSESVFHCYFQQPDYQYETLCAIVHMHTNSKQLKNDSVESEKWLGF